MGDTHFINVGKVKDDSIVKGGEFKFGGTSVETAGAINVAIDEERSTNTEGVLKSGKYFNTAAHQN